MERRSFLVGGTAAALATLTADLWTPVLAAVPGPGPYGQLAVADPNGVQLPAGFTSRIIGRTGQVVAGTSYKWHSAPDGGACFPATGDGWVYVSNSEVSGGQGGVSAIRFLADGTIDDAYSILQGTSRNCSGGHTPWGTWLSGEEIGPPGAVFECNPQAAGQGIRRGALGLFSHEAVAVDPLTGSLYLTEDEPNGRLYRFVPNTPGDLSTGSLWAASVTGTTVTWIPTSPTGPDRQAQTTIFRGGEGIYAGNGFVYFTTKYDRRVWRIDPTRDEIAVMHDCQSSSTALDAVDNVTVHEPSGDVYIAEDGGNMELCVFAVVDGKSQAAAFCRFRGQDSSEVTGPAFSPDGTRLYVSSQRGTDGTTGITYEITGPFRTQSQGPGPRITVLYMSDDSYVRAGNYAAANYGTESLMAVSDSSIDNYKRWTYLAADLTPGTDEIENAILQLRGRLSGGPASNSVVYGVADTTWTNTSINWTNRPALGAELGRFKATSASSTWFEVDVTSWVAERRAAGDRRVSFAVCQEPGSQCLVVVESREASSAGSRLVITTPGAGSPPPPPNVDPIAAFTPTVTDLSVNVDGTASSDPDGAIGNYAWDFGDSTSASGSTASHTYASEGAYTIVLTVTDNRGGTNTTSREVQVVAPSTPPFKVTDDFSRSVSNGWGSAQTGGPWSVLGRSTLYGVANSVGSQRLDVGGRTTAARLDQVSETEISMAVDLSIDKPITGGGLYSYLMVRLNGENGYRLRARAETSKTTLTLYKRVGGSFTALASTTLNGFVLDPAKIYRVSLTAAGVTPTALSGKIWDADTSEPTAPQVATNDATATLQAPGGVGFETYMSGSVTNAPLTVGYRNLLATAGQV